MPDEDAGELAADGGTSETTRWTDYDVMVPMRDGTRLGTQIHFPTGASGRLSAVLVRSPYEDTWPEGNPTGFGYLVRRNYVVVTQYVRGRFGSEGEYVPFAHEYADGRDAVDWVLAQPWSNGRVATAGASYLGYTAAAAAAANERVAVALVDGAPIGGFDGWPSRRGGTGLSEGFSWYALTEGWVSLDGGDFAEITNHLPFITIDEAVAGHALGWHRELVNAYVDPASPFWAEQTLRDRLTGYCVPTIHIQAHQEFADDPSEIFEVVRRDGCAETRALQKLVFAAGLHGETTHDIYDDFERPGGRDNPAHRAIDRFLARYLDGADDDLGDVPAVTYYDHGLGAWSSLDAWPPPSHEVTFRLGAGSDISQGTLRMGPPADPTPVSFVYDPAAQDPCDTTFVEAYFGVELAERLTFAGRPRVHLAASSTAPDTELWVTLYWLPPGAADWLIETGGAVRASFRHGGRASPPLVPRERTAFDLAIDRRVHTFPAGTTILLGIASSQCGQSENPNTGEPIGRETTRASATQTLFFDGPDPSTITFDVPDPSR